MTHKNIDDYFDSLAHEDEQWNKHSKALKPVPGTPISTVMLKEDVKTDKDDDFFVTLGTMCRYANHVVRDLFGAASSTKMEIFDDIFLNPTSWITDFFATLETAPRQATHAIITKENTAPTCVPGSLISTVILTEDVKTDENNDFFVTLGTMCRYANYAVRDLFGAASSTKIKNFDDIFLNPTYEMIEENRNVTVPSTSAVIEVEEWNTGSHFSSTQMSLLEQNENIFGLSLCEYANFEIGTSGTYGWEVDPFSGVSRLYRTVQHAFEIGESGEGIVLDSSTNAEYKPITEDTIDDTPASHGNEMTTKGLFTCLDCTD